MSAANCAFTGELTIYRAAELKQQVLDAMATGADTVFDLSGVEEIDTAGIQLLLLAQREAAARGGTLRLEAPSAAVREALDLLAVTALLNTTNQPGEAS